MRCFKSVFLVVVVLCAAITATAQEQVPFSVVKLADQIYELSTDGGGYTVKVIASVGKDGLLLVDAGKQKTVAALKTALRSISAADPAIIISTHSHIEHVGGNHGLVPGPVIIGHTKLRDILRSGSFLFDEFSEQTIPQITFSDSMSLFFNGEEIKLYAFAGAHDECDIIIWFTGSKIVCVGGVANGRHFPSVDPQGDVLKFPPVVKRLLKILPDDVTIVPGHGENGTKADLQAFYDMLVETEALVRAELAKGKDLPALQKEDILRAYAPFECSYVSKSDWIEYLVKGIQPDDSTAVKQTLFEPLYNAMHAGGPDSAIALYYDLKARAHDAYKFDEPTLVVIGYRLFEGSRYAESIPFFRLAAAEYPAGDYASIVFRLLGLAHVQTGDTVEAIKSLRACLKKNPADTQAKETLNALKRK